MDFTMQQLEDMDELDRLYLFEDIPEEDLKAHIESLPEDERGGSACADSRRGPL